MEALKEAPVVRNEIERVERKRRLREEKRYTVDYVENLPEGERAELINGRIYMMACPTTRHQLLLLEVYDRIKACIKEHGKECKVFLSPCAVYIDDDVRTYLVPDLFVVCDKEKIKMDGVHGAPDWVLEVLSPSTALKDCTIKQKKYKEIGVREYWIVDPESGDVAVYDFEKDEMETYDAGEAVPFSICPELEIDFAELLQEI